VENPTRVFLSGDGAEAILDELLDLPADERAARRERNVALKIIRGASF